MSLVVSFNVVTFSGVAFGNTSTGTFTVSSPVGYVTVVGTVTSFAPTLPVVSGKAVSVGALAVPPLPGVTAFLTFSASGFVPSTVYTVFVSEPNTLIVTGTVVVYSVPSTVYVAGTFTTPLFVPFSFVRVAATASVISPTVTVAPAGNFPLKSAASTNSFAFAFATSFTLSTVEPFGISASPVAFGNTVTGTLTVSVNLPLSYVTGTVTSLFPALAVISSAITGSPFVPSVPAVTAPFTSSFVTVSPSNTTNFLAVEPTTVTGTVTSLVATTLLFASLYSTTTVAGV